MRIFSHASQRVLNYAKQQAKLAYRDSILVPDLAIGLLTEESRVTLYFQEQKYDLEGIRDQLIQKFLPTVITESQQIDNHAESEPKFSDDLEELLRRAHLIASREEKDAEIGTDHILAALCESDDPISEFLLELNFDISAIFTDSFDLITDQDQPLEFHETLLIESKDISEEASAWRMIDASANRSMEGFRVVEDFIRFQTNQEQWYQQIKALRHGLTTALAHVSLHSRLKYRDSVQDVGTKVSLPSERTRSTLSDLFSANCSRLKESLRSLEEYLKLFSTESAMRVEQIRYQFYELEKQVLSRIIAKNTIDDPALYLIVSERSCEHGIGPAVKEALTNGASIIQLREKSQTDRRILELGRRIREWTRDAGACFIMNDRPDLAVLCEADGVHVGQDEISVKDVRKIIGPNRMIGVSTHSLEQAHQAERDGADYIGVGPVFPSQTKEFETHVGIDLINSVAEEIYIPWFAIGGINPGNISELIQSGCRRVVVSHAICSSPKPGEVTSELVNQLIFASNADKNNSTD